MEHYESVIDLEENLEDYDSDIDVACRVYDHLGRPVHLKLKLLEVREYSWLRTVMVMSIRINSYVS